MIVFHIDMDSHFASVEQQARPWLWGKPIVVSGRPDIHSVVAAASKEAKRFGIRAGMPTWEAKRLCPQVIFIPGDPDKYESVTRRFLAILVSYAPMVEVYFIDEVFLDATDVVRRYRDPVALAKEIKARFREEPQVRRSQSIALVGRGGMSYKVQGSLFPREPPRKAPWSRPWPVFCKGGFSVSIFSAKSTVLPNEHAFRITVESWFGVCLCK